MTLALVTGAIVFIILAKLGSDWNVRREYRNAQRRKDAEIARLREEIATGLLLDSVIFTTSQREPAHYSDSRNYDITIVNPDASTRYGLN